MTIYKYIKMAVSAGLLECDNHGRLEIPRNQKELFAFKRFHKNHPITQDPLVADWLEDLFTRKQGDNIVTWKTRVRSLESICNTCNISPKKLLVSQRQTEKFLKRYLQLYREDRTDRDPRGMRRSNDIKNIVYQKAQGIRDFCGYHGMIWKRGVRGIMSQAIPNHGKYGDIRLTDSELEKADAFIKERWGLDSDIYRWFWIGIESCARFSALYSMNLDYTRHASKGKTTYIMTAYESKTRHIRGGKWAKFITRPDTQRSIDLLRARGGTRIYESKLYKHKFRAYITGCLRQVYTHLGKCDYFFASPTQALRHVGAHYWLAKKNYHHGLVSIIGGWNTTDELIKSYGQIPPERVLEMIEDDSLRMDFQLVH